MLALTVLLGVVIVVQAVLLATVVRRSEQVIVATADRHRESLEAITQTLAHTQERLFGHIQAIDKIGGITHDQWREKHQIEEKKLKLQEKQMEIDAEIKRPLMEEKIKKQMLRMRIDGLKKSANGTGTIRNPSL